MSDKIREIVDQIVKSVVSLDGLDRIEKKLANRFRRKGYRFDEIRQAFTYIFRILRTAEGGKAGSENERPVRLLSPDESIKLTDPAKSVVLRAYYCAEIDSFDLERILGFVSSQEKVLSEVDIMALFGLGVSGRKQTEN